MTGFAALKDISNAFEEDIRRDSSELFTTKLGESFEDGVLKKMRDILLFTSKLRLLIAKPLASTPQITEQDKANVIGNYEETATWSIIEQQSVKSIIQAHAVKSLMTAPNSKLNPEMRERKQKIKEQLLKHRNLETQLRHLNMVLMEKENEHTMVQAQWHRELGALRHIRASADNMEEIDSNGPLYQKLRTVVDKMELMRRLLSKFVTARTGRSYDWLADPHRRFAALKLSREAITVEGFTVDHN